jgi:hypothetical protein
MPSVQSDSSITRHILKNQDRFDNELKKYALANSQADEIEALCKAVGDSGRGVIGVNGGENLSFADCYVLQPKVGAPITYTALLTTSQGTHLAAVEVHKEGLRQGVDVWPQVSCRPLSFSMTMVEPFTLNTSPIFAELMPVYAKNGYKYAESNPELENNTKMSSQWSDFEHECHKTRRVYIKNL